MRKVNSEASLISRITIQVRFSEIDYMKVVWHGEYVKYFEDAREHFGREYEGLGYMDFMQNEKPAPIVDLHLQYKKPLRCNDRAIVEIRYINTESAKIYFEYTIYKEDTMEIVATGSTVQVFLDNTGALELVSPKFYLQWKKRWVIE